MAAKSAATILARAAVGTSTRSAVEHPCTELFGQAAFFRGLLHFLPTPLLWFTMLLAPESASRFINNYKTILLEVLRAMGESPTGNVVHDLARARTHCTQHPEAMATAISTLQDAGHALDAEVVRSVNTLKVAQWVYLRHTTRYAIFLDKAVKNAYAVKALTTPIHLVVGGQAAAFETGLVEFEDQFVCDGIVLGPVFLGPGYRAEFNAMYSDLRKSEHFFVNPSSRDMARVAKVLISKARKG